MRPFVSFAIFFLPSLLAAEEDVNQVLIILFVPADLPIPEGWQERMDQIVNYTQGFLRKGFEDWGHKDFVTPFRHTADGHAEVMVVRGQQPASMYRDVSLRAEAIVTARENYRIEAVKQVWWIFVYVGDPPEKFKGYRGGFDPKFGGWSVCNYDTRPGEIDPTQPLGSTLLVDLTLKGMIHELGHAFQLPHIGPRAGDNAGNSLMGPTHDSFRRFTAGRDQRVYLSEAAAAILSQHPAFRGTPDRRRLPRVEVVEQRYSKTESGTRVSGRVRSDIRPTYAIVADESDARPGEYWTKHYVGKVEEDGRYGVAIFEPAATNGSLKTWFVFENGAMTGDGRRPGKAGALAKPYQNGNFRTDRR